MKKWIAFLCAAAVMTGALAGCGAQSQQSSENGTTEQAATDASGDLSGLSDKFGAAVKQNEFEGVAYAAQNGEKLFESESGQGYNADTVYHIASLSKQFTAAAILMWGVGDAAAALVRDFICPDVAGNARRGAGFIGYQIQGIYEVSAHAVEDIRAVTDVGFPLLDTALKERAEQAPCLNVAVIVHVERVNII